MLMTSCSKIIHYKYIDQQQLTVNMLYHIVYVLVSTVLCIPTTVTMLCF